MGVILKNKAIIKPTWQSASVILYKGICQPILKQCASEQFHAVVTDPPFGIGFKYLLSREDHRQANRYADWLMPIYNDAMRCLKPGGFSAWWQTQLYFKYFWDWFGDDIRIYAACKNFVQLRKTPINYGYDPVIMKYKEGTPLRPDRPKRSIDFFVANTAASVSNSSRIERAHPCPRPLDAAEAIISNFTLPGGVVLDPFMGSGTIGVACIKLGRRYVGIDAEPEYFDIAKKRILAALDGEFVCQGRGQSQSLESSVQPVKGSHKQNP